MASRQTRLDDANEDVNQSMQELSAKCDDRIRTRAVVRVLGSIAVTLAMMLDHMKGK